MILNLHFDATGHTAQMPPLTGLTGGVAQWLFCRDGLASVTVSAADRFADDTAEALAAGSGRKSPSHWATGRCPCPHFGS